MKPELEIQITKEDLVSKGYIPLSKEELVGLLSNTTVSGDYEYSGHRRYKTFMNANGKMTGKNDWGSTEYGKWTVDDNGYLSVAWEGYWEDWTTVVFEVDGDIKLYNIEDGKWVTTFDNIVQGEQSLEVGRE